LSRSFRKYIERWGLKFWLSRTLFFNPFTISFRFSNKA
jgi:hypothetical protein